MSTPEPKQVATIQDDDTSELMDMQAVFDEEEVLDDEPRSIFKDIISQIVAGQDLTRISMPAFISEPRAFIETTANLFSHISFFREALAATDPVDRIALLTRFYISGFHIRPRGVKKPYNPILGEVFRCFWDHSDGTRTWYIAEQVSHHPPISAFYFENLDSGYTIEGQIQIKANFTGNAAGTFMVGTIFVHLLRYRETYTITYPVWYARGVVFGNMRMETVGKTHIMCEQTGLESQIDFKAKPKWGGKYNQVEAYIYPMNDGPKPMDPPHPTPQEPPMVMPGEAHKPSDKRGKALIHIWGDWTSALYATDLRKTPSLTTPYTPEMLREAAEIQWRLQHNMQPYDADTATDPLPTLTPAPLPSRCPKNTVLFFDVQCSPFISKRCLSTAMQKPYESRQVWANLTESLLHQDFEQAREDKIAVEERQRAVLKARTKQRKGFRQRFFYFDPFPRTNEEALAYPEGRYRLQYSIDCTSSQQEIDPSNRLFSCYNLPDMNELMETYPILTEDLITRDEDARTTDFLPVEQAAKVLRERKAQADAAAAAPGAEEEGEKKKQESTAASASSSTAAFSIPDVAALRAEGIFGPKWPMGDPPVETSRTAAAAAAPAPAD